VEGAVVAERVHAAHPSCEKGRTHAKASKTALASVKAYRAQDCDWSVRHGPVIMLISHVWSVGTEVPCPRVLAELCNASVFVTLLISARTQWLLAFSGRSVIDVVCSRVC
jgi:hypothetical protein